MKIPDVVANRSVIYGTIIILIFHRQTTSRKMKWHYRIVTIPPDVTVVEEKAYRNAATQTAAEADGSDAVNAMDGVEERHPQELSYAGVIMERCAVQYVKVVVKFIAPNVKVMVASIIRLVYELNGIHARLRGTVKTHFYLRKKLRKRNVSTFGQISSNHGRRIHPLMNLFAPFKKTKQMKTFS